jgi:hypothetical protein
MEATEVKHLSGMFEEQIREHLSRVDWRREEERRRVYGSLEERTREHCSELRSRGQAKDVAEGIGDAMRAAIDSVEQQIALSINEPSEQTAKIPAGTIQHSMEKLMSFFSSVRSSDREAPVLEAALTETEPQAARKLSMKVPIVSAIALVGVLGVLGLQAWQILEPGGGADLSNCSPTSERCFDTGWQPVSNKTSSIYFYRHRLGATPRIISAWFSPTADGRQAFSLSQSFPAPNVGNPITLEVRPDVVLINVWSGAPIRGLYDGRSQKWTEYSEGFYRIVAIK